MWEDGGTFCFGCRATSSPTMSPYVYKEKVEEDEETIKLPDDASFDYKNPGLAWCLKYGITIQELINNKVYWSERKQQIVFTWWDDEENLLAYQARNFLPSSKLKYYTQGDVNSLLPVYQANSAVRGERIVVVEDCLSAIKIARQSDAMPCLGSDLPPTKINRMVRLYGTFLVWLDGNMYTNAQRIARRAGLLGCSTEVVWTEKDPKDYSDTELSLHLGLDKTRKL